MFDSKVSLLIPIYGVEQYIERCVRSLMEQTYEHCEFVFVDDCTTDKSVTILEYILEQYPHRRKQVKIIHHEYNKGLGAARLSAIKNSTGRYISFVDSDDWVEHDYVKRLVEVADSQNADLVTSHFNANKSDVYEEDADLFLRKLLMRRRSPHIWGNLVRRDIMDLYGILPIEGIDMAEDFHFMVKYLCVCSRVFSIGELLYHYTPDNPNSYTNRYSIKNIKSEINSLDSVYSYVMKIHPEFRCLLNVSFLEFYKASVINSNKNNVGGRNLYADYLKKNRKLNLSEKLYLYTIEHCSSFFIKIISFYFSVKYKV